MSHLGVSHLSAALDGVLAGPVGLDAAAHLAACPLCRDHQARLARHDDTLRRLLAVEPGDAYLAELSRKVEALVTSMGRGLAEPPSGPSEPVASPSLLPGSPAPTALDGVAATPTEAAPAASTPSAARAISIVSLEPQPPAPPPPPQAEPARAEEATAPASPEPDDAARAKPWFLVPPDPEHARYMPKPPAGWEAPAPGAKSPASHSGFGGGRGFAHGGPWSADRPESEETALASSPPEPASRGARSALPPAEPATRPARSPFAPDVSRPPAWARWGFEPDPSEPGLYRRPIVEPPPAEAPIASPGNWPAQVARVLRAPAAAASALVGALLLVVLMVRSTPSRPALGHTAHETRRAAGAGAPAVRDAATPHDVDSRVPPARAADNSPAHAAPQSVCGRVVDMVGDPVTGARISISGTTIAVRSGEDGRFCITAPGGEHVVVIERAGIGPERLKVSFVEDAPELRILLP